MQFHLRPSVGKPTEFCGQSPSDYRSVKCFSLPSQSKQDPKIRVSRRWNWVWSGHKKRRFSRYQVQCKFDRIETSYLLFRTYSCDCELRPWWANRPVCFCCADVVHHEDDHDDNACKVVRQGSQRVRWDRRRRAAAEAVAGGDQHLGQGGRSRCKLVRLG